MRDVAGQFESAGGLRAPDACQPYLKGADRFAPGHETSGVKLQEAYQLHSPKSSSEFYAYDSRLEASRKSLVLFLGKD